MLHLPACQWLYSEHDAAVGYVAAVFEARRRWNFAGAGSDGVISYRMFLLFPLVVLRRLKSILLGVFAGEEIFSAAHSELVLPHRLINCGSHGRDGEPGFVNGSEVPHRQPDCGGGPVINSAAQQPLVDHKFLFSRMLLLMSILSGIGLSVPCLTAGAVGDGRIWHVLDRVRWAALAIMWERSLNYEDLPPFSQWLHRVVLNVLGESEFTFRVPTTLCYVLAIYVVTSSAAFSHTTFGGLVAIVTAWHPSRTSGSHVCPMLRCYSAVVGTVLSVCGALVKGPIRLFVGFLLDRRLYRIGVDFTI